MHYFLALLLIVLGNISAYGQVSFRFTGNGLWTTATNWQLQTIPPDTLRAGDSIIIQSAPADSCLLNKQQVVAPGATLHVIAGSRLIIPNGIVITGAVPALITRTVTGIYGNYALSGGTITTDGGSPVFEKGVVWGTSPLPVISAAAKTTDGGGNDSFSSYMRILLPNTRYYVRAYATNTTGTAYGNELSFTTTADLLPELVVQAVDTITAIRASAIGRVNSDLTPILTHGFCWDSTRLPTTALSTKTVKGTMTPPYDFLWDILTNLAPGTTYYLRAYAITSVGTAYSNEYIFSTDTLKVPSLSNPSLSGSFDALGALTSTASGSSNVNTNGAPVIARGLCWDSLPNPEISRSDTSISGSGTGFFTAAIRNLQPNTTYYVRAYAINSAGTGYSGTVLIRSWMPKNLDVVTYRNGDTIPQITDSAEWANTTTGAWCYYDNDTANGTVYGKLYNYYALTDPRGLAPQGWRLPTEDDWNALSNLIPNQTGGRMKATVLWMAPNSGATNSSRFTGLPGGFRLPNASFAASKGYFGEWWSDFRFGYLFGRRLSYNNASLPQVYTNLNLPAAMRAGRAVRCIQE